MTSKIFPQQGYEPSSCSSQYSQMMGSEDVYNKAMKQNPQLAKDGLDPGSCKTSSTTNNESAEGVDVFAGGGAKESDDYSKDTSSGCSAVAIQYAMNEGMSNTLNCTCQSLQSDATNNIKDVEQIEIEFDNDSFKKNLKITNDQTSQTNVKMINFLSASVQNQLTNSAQSTINSFQQSTQNQKSNANFTTPTAQKSLQDNINSTLQSAGQTVNSDTMSTVVNSLCEIKNSKLVFKDDTFMGNVDITNLQQSSLTYMAQNISKGLVGAVMKNSTLDTEISKTTQMQKSVLDKKKKEESNFLKYILITLVFLIAITVFSIDKFKNTTIKPTYRTFAFWTAFVVMVLAMILENKAQGFWITLLVLFILTIMINIKEFHEKQIILGGGLHYIIPKKSKTTTTSQTNGSPSTQSQSTTTTTSPSTQG